MLLHINTIAIKRDNVLPAPPKVANISWNWPVIMFGISTPALNASKFSADNIFNIGLYTAPTTLPPFIPKNQKKCKNMYAITIAPKLFPKCNNGICKNLYMNSCTLP